jgi:hypothetical protein
MVAVHQRKEEFNKLSIELLIEIGELFWQEI